MTVMIGRPALDGSDGDGSLLTHQGLTSRQLHFHNTSHSLTALVAS